jgi:hypothetical protein
MRKPDQETRQLAKPDRPLTFYCRQLIAYRLNFEPPSSAMDRIRR